MTSEEDKYKDIFHYLTFNKMSEKDFNFYLFDEKTNQKQKYDTPSCLIPDPAIDSTFKSIFGNKSKRFENFLNSVYFKPKNMEISNISYLVGEFNEIGKLFNINCLRADIACKGNVKIKDTKKELLLDIEIQINWIEELDDKLFEYGSLLRNGYSNKINEERKEKNKEDKKDEGGTDEEIKENKKNYENEIIMEKKEETVKKIDNKRVYLDTLCIAFVVGNNTKPSNEIKLVRNDGSSSIELDKFKIVEINVFKEWYLIQLSSKNSILENLSKDGKDWIKLLSLRAWAKKGENPSPKYLFPVLSKEHKYSTNEYIEDTIKELIIGNRMILTLYSEIEKFGNDMRSLGKEEGKVIGKKEGLIEGKKIGMAEGRKKEEKISQILCAYYYFISQKNIDEFYFDYKYTLDEVNTILYEKVNSIKLLNEENMTNFLVALEKKKIIQL